MTLVGYCQTPVGCVKVTVERRKTTSVRFMGGKKRAFRVPKNAMLQRRIKEVSGCFAGRRVKSSPLEPTGTAFQKKVWKEILRIPAASTMSYKELARRVGRPRAIRAVANACAKNPLPVLIPCHRVVASGGHLGGYSGGLRRKRWLLAHEALNAL